MSMNENVWNLLPKIRGIIVEPPKNRLKGINIETEYKLIQQKKSRLSSRLRAEVVYKYERGM